LPAGPLLISVDDSGVVLGLDHDYDRVQPKNGDGFMNWLTTHLVDALGHPPVTRVGARIAVHHDKQICRAMSPETMGLCSFAKTSKGERVLFARFNNSTRAVPVDKIVTYVSLRWPT
jgi:type I restriction enzyme, R subunit